MQDGDERINKSRSLSILHSDRDDSDFLKNEVQTAKYTVLEFLPKSLFEQFRRLPNVYFLLVSIIQMTTSLSPTNEFSTITPLIIVLLISMIKEAVEDRVRHKVCSM